MYIFLIVITVVAVLALTLLIVDKAIYDERLNKVQPGMTGYEVQTYMKKKLRIVSVEPDGYVAKVVSMSHLFKHRLYFKNGKLIRKMRE